MGKFLKPKLISKGLLILFITSLFFTLSFTQTAGAQTGEIQAAQQAPKQVPDNIKTDAATASANVPAQAPQTPAVETQMPAIPANVTVPAAPAVEVPKPETTVVTPAAPVAAPVVETTKTEAVTITPAVPAMPAPAAATKAETVVTTTAPAIPAAPAVPPAVPAAETKPAVQVTAPAAEIKIPAPVQDQTPAAADATPKPEKITVSQNTFYLVPGEELDLTPVKALVTYTDKSTRETAISWKCDTGTIALTKYTAPASSVIAGLAAEFTDGGTTISAPVTVKVRNRFRSERITILILTLLLASIVFISINIAVGGKDYFIRKIGGLSAIDEAVGRATEMGKPVLYITGLGDVSSLPTIASLSILSYVAKKTAEYETALLVPCCRSLVMNTAREIVKESYLEAARPDSYNPDNIKYLTDDQFGFVSGVDGIMLREKPAANFYLGHFMAESLIYAETGNSIGAIQIAGTSEFSQIPFFVAACDYCLIGEELFAASAYLSRKPKDVGTLRGQDICKLAIMAVILIGVALETVAVLNPELAPSMGVFKAMFTSK